MASAASRTAGSAGPAPVSIALRVALTSSMRRATTTLNFVCSTRPGASASSRCVTRRSAGSPSAQIDVGRARDVLRDAPGAREELLRARGRDVLPVDVVLDGPGEGDRDAHGVGAGVDHARGELDQVALALGHLRAVEQHHALVDQARERLGELDEAHVEQHLGDEARVQQVQDRVLDAADVGVDRAPTCWPRAVENASSASLGARKRRKYHELSTNVSIVSGSRSAGSPVSGSTVCIHSVAPPERRRALRREVEPLARRGASAAAGRREPGTMRPSSVWIIGIGVPQKRWREISQSRRR